MKAISSKALKLVKVNTTGLTKRSIKVNGKRINLKVMVNIIGLMVVSTMANGLKISCMGKVHYIMKMEGHTLDNLNQTKNMDMEFTNGRMGKCTLAIGI